MSGVHTLIIRHRVLMFAATLLVGAASSSGLFAHEPISFASSSINYHETDGPAPTSLQVIADTEPVEMLPSGRIPPVPGEPYPNVPTQVMDGRDVAPLLDDCNDSHDPVIGEELGESYNGRRGVRPYGGGHPSDWWG